jgi:hypothetical protein
LGYQPARWRSLDGSIAEYDSSTATMAFVSSRLATDGRAFSTLRTLLPLRLFNQQSFPRRPRGKLGYRVGSWWTQPLSPRQLPCISISDSLSHPSSVIHRQSSSEYPYHTHTSSTKFNLHLFLEVTPFSPHLFCLFLPEGIRPAEIDTEFLPWF